ncbi:ATP-dependent RecD-like DNA helicase [anaerobic digester metagenome]
MIEPVKNKIIPKGFNEGQVRVTNEIIDFIKSDRLEHVLAGYAGTGKTFVLNYIINKLCDFPVCVTAPTHKALRMIEKQVGRKGKTFQSLHGLRPNLDLANFNITNPQFDPRGSVHIDAYKLIIVDESSMITNDLYKLNTERCNTYKTKMLYVGDPLQLPPVQDEIKLSPIFSLPNVSLLTEIVRQEEGHPLLSVFPMLRSDIIDKTNNAFEYLMLNRNSMINDTGYRIDNERKFYDNITDYYKLDEIRDNPDCIRTVAYSNDAVSINNREIRKRLFNNSKFLLEDGDVLTAYNTIVDEYNMPIIINSEDYVINSMRDYINQYGIKTYAVNLQSTYDNRLTTTLQIVDHTHDSFIIYYNMLNELHTAAITAPKSERNKKWVEYYRFKDTLLTMVKFQLNATNKHATVKKDVDYAYSITAHKAQGSTYDNVMIDLKDIAYYTKNGRLYERFDKEMVNRLLYVALSRTKQQAILKM